MKLKHLLRYPFDIRVAEEHLASPSKVDVETTEATIGIDLYSDQMLFDGGRHLACLAASAGKIGSKVILRCSRWLLAAIAHKSHGGRFLSMPNVCWIDPQATFPPQSLVLLDTDGGQADRVLSRQRTVAMLIGRDPVDKTLVMPYPMHPQQITDATEAREDMLRRRIKAGIFFAGNQNRRYGRDSMHHEFGVLSRLEILSTLRSHFDVRIATRDSGGRDDQIVLRDSASDPIPAQDWMNTIAAHQFFLCCPGASQPVCHNAIEAMSVGTIPILEYADRFHPELVDGVNAICFRGRKGLVAAIRRIDSMPPEKRARLSRNVCQHYDAHLDGGRFLKRLRDELNTDFVDQVSMPFHNRNFYSTSSPPSGRVPLGHRRAA
ncbi:hypothetical protein Mal15_34290 [Stieleria maiorica]|uniref:Exostosin family protein n=1 Tax=Stieleria maiorica TaxID=2795974 RepID=A0A5B9MIC9_9BACT|nr:hypothetical protein [Stieleria maiorica]QEF99365.1 hypothetical protein Mal15_34290 [Stieleria maiorica]